MTLLRLAFPLQSMWIFPAIAALILASMPPPALAADYTERSVIGKWRLTAALDASQITALDEHEAQQLVGKVFTVSQDQIKLGVRKCSASDFVAERVEPRLYFREQAHASASKLGLPNPVTVVNLGCTVAFIKTKDRLVIHWDGGSSMPDDSGNWTGHEQYLQVR